MTVSAAVPEGGPAPGTEIGSFRVVKVIGRGGMGVVLEVRHTRAGQRAALKLLAPERRGGVGDTAVRRFLSEATILSRLEHPGLVRILDHGESPEHGPWIAMEYVAGEVLRARLERNPAGLRVAVVLPMLRRIASAVAAIHAAGIVHRDLKPDNVMVTPDDEVPGGERIKLLDFGIAKITDDARHTTEGTVLGTAGYMAPEQCAGDRDLDDRVDVYALGVLGFELFTGAPPFTGGGPDVMRQHLFAEPPLDRLPASIPDGTRELLRLMLAKEPSRRPAIGDVVARLRMLEAAIAATPEPEPALASAATEPAPRAAAGTAETAPARSTAPATDPAAEPSPARRRTRRVWPWIAAGTAAVLALSAGAWKLWKRAEPSARRAAHVLPGMVRVPTTTFDMGSSLAELDAACAELPGGCVPAERPQLEREQPVRRVTVSAFQLDAREVTNRDFVAFLTGRRAELRLRDDRDAHYPRFVDELATGTTLVDLDRGGTAISGEHVDGGPDVHFTILPGAEELPVHVVTWDGATRYCHAQGKRLPTEAEWEAAARGGTHRRFPWGNEAPRCESVVFGREDTRGCPARRAAHQAVATSPQDVTPTGIHDLAGSVSEWVQDSFVASYRDCGGCTNPVVEEQVRLEDDFRIFRGGNYVSPAWMSRTTTRSRSRRTYGKYGLGFRCATR